MSLACFTKSILHSCTEITIKLESGCHLYENSSLPTMIKPQPDAKIIIYLLSSVFYNIANRMYIAYWSKNIWIFDGTYTP